MVNRRRKNIKKSFWMICRDSLFLGLLTLAPTVLTFWILFSIVSFMDRSIYRLIPGVTQPEQLFGFYIPGIGIVLTLVLLIFVGTLARTVAGKFFKAYFDTLLKKVPVVGNIYSAVKQMGEVFFSNSGEERFKRVYWIPFPSQNSRALGFATGQMESGEISVFIPTAPNPTSGYVLFYKEEDLQIADMSVDQALQMIVSCGFVSKKGAHA